MIKFFLLFMLIPTSAFAGFIVCHDGAGNLADSGTCVYYSDQTTGVVAHDRVQITLRTIPRKYLKWTTEPVEMTQIEKDAVDVVDASAILSSQRNGAKSRFNGMNPESLAFRATMEIIRDEINILRSLHGLPPRTLSQLKTAIKNKIDSGDIDE